MRKKKKKNVFQKITRVFVVLVIICLILLGAFYVVNYMLGEVTVENADGTTTKVYVKKKTEINALISGTNDNLTDTIIYVNYNVSSGKIAMMSIPRDTYITNDLCVGHKLNALYRGKNTDAFVKQIEELIGKKIDYYLIFDAEMLHGIVDAIGGIEVEVPLRMKYDDPTQNLHIDLKPGKQVLNGQQAEWFVRYRKSNDGVSYARGDLQRTEVQQGFIKSLITEILSAKNITKIPEIVNIALNNTDSNITTREALRYVTDVPKIDTSSISSLTAPGSAKYINGVSYFVLDEEKTKELVQNKLIEENTDVVQ